VCLYRLLCFLNNFKEKKIVLLKWERVSRVLCDTKNFTAVRQRMLYGIELGGEEPTRQKISVAR
jgi:hypothetical protein